LLKNLQKFTTSIPWIVFALCFGVANFIFGNNFYNFIIGFILIFVAVQSVLWRRRKSRISNS